jgi:rRNA maturation endonuclease Nob1
MIDVSAMSENLKYDGTTKKYIRNFFEGLGKNIRVNNLSKTDLEKINSGVDLHPLEEKKYQSYLLYDSVKIANKELGLLNTINDAFDKMDNILKK